MDESLKHHNPNPELKANVISKILFWWINPLFKTGYVRQLEVEDMFNVVKADQSEHLGTRIHSEWQKEIHRCKDGKGQPSLFRCLFRMFGLEYVLFGIVLFMEEATKVIQPLLLGGLIRYFTPNSTVSKTECYLYAMGVSLCAIVLAVAHHPYFFGVQRIGMKMRIACCSLIYRKSLRLSNAGLSGTTTGQIVNLMSNDVNRFDQAVIFLHFLWIGPLEAIAVLAILWRELGASTLAGFGVLLLLVPVQGWMGKLFSKFRQKTATHTDERVRLMNEIIAGMRVIKMYCWEKPFGDLVRKVRRCEVHHIEVLGYIKGLILGPFFASAKLICLVVFVVYVEMGGRLRSELVFVTVNLYQAIRLACTLFVPFAIQATAETRITFKRLQVQETMIIDTLFAVSDNIPNLSSKYNWAEYVCVMKARFSSLGMMVALDVYPQTLVYFLFMIPALRGVPLRAEAIFPCIPLVRLFSLNFVHYTFLYNLFTQLQTRVALQRIQRASRITVSKAFSLSIKPPNKAEYLTILKARYSSLGMTLALDISPKVLMFFLVVIPALRGEPLRAETIFPCIPLVRLFSIVIHYTFLCNLFLHLQTQVAFKRIQTFLMLDELPDDHATPQEHVPLKECGVEIDNITAKWDEAIDQNTIQNVSASVKTGKLLAVIGPVGAGKSSLLMSILKELPVSQGDIKVKGRIAYVAQQPWVFSASLRQNITFGNKFEKIKYDRILKACALNKDVDVMPHGDLTLIGDRGVSLSGGQRARVSLARALYMEADVYLLDDPLSAVDASVGRHLFENVIQGLLKSKPRILVTHQLQFLKQAEEILILKEGEMIGKGTFQDLSVSGVDFSSLLKRDKEDGEDPKHSKSHDPHTMSTHDHHKSHDYLHSKSHDHIGHGGVLRQRSRLDSTKSHHSINDKGSLMSLTSIGTEFEAEMVQLPEEEERREGTVGMSTYYQYFKAGAGCIKGILCAVLCVTAQLAYVASDWWLSYWSNQEEARYGAIDLDAKLRLAGNNVTNVTIPEVDTHFNISVFSGLIGAVFFFGLIRALMFFKVTVDASQHLHNRMFAGILRSHIGFFDTNPVGRILNRFSKDIGHMDDLLPITFFDFVQCSLLILGIIIVAGVVNPWVFIPVVPLAVLFVIIRRYYLRTSRHVKRLEATTRSPVFSHLSATLLGLQTIRAFGVQDKFIDEFDSHQDIHTEAWFLFLATSRWLAIRLDWLCAMFVTAVSFSCVLAADSLNAGLVGLSMTYAMTLMGMFQWGVRQSAEVENQMISVERVLDYSRLPSEAPLEVDEKKAPPPDWPQEGVISVIGAGLRYSPNSPEVLKSISFTIQSKEKIGIVGRTGAGKSSLITMLFRLVEPTGTVLIDNINIQTIGLHDLRKHISIIPQDPVLFTGTLRRNLDPFNKHNDEGLWRAITEVQLKQAIEDLPQGLDSEMSEGGTNFSVGQRQLICLARAILGHNKILMIDEATANVDPRTDALIQETIREKFKSCSVLTIAHRLNTIMDSDRILVLEEGRVVEFDSPYLLLQNTNGVLRKLVEQTGKSETMHLLNIAQTSYQKHQKGSLGDYSVGVTDNGVAGISLMAEDSTSNGPVAAIQDVSLVIDEDEEDVNDSNGEKPDINPENVGEVKNEKSEVEMDQNHTQEDGVTDESTKLLGNEENGEKVEDISETGNVTDDKTDEASKLLANGEDVDELVREDNGAKDIELKDTIDENDADTEVNEDDPLLNEKN